MKKIVRQITSGSFLMLVSMLAGCSSGGSGSGGSGATDTTAPVVYNLGIDASAWDPVENNNTAVLAVEGNRYKLFIEFGGTESADATTDPFYHLTFRIHDNDPTSYPVRATIDGIVKAIDDQQAVSGDFEVRIAPNANSVWVAVLDHVDDLSISVGDTVTADQVIGVASPAYFEFNLLNTSEQRSYCPMQYLDPAAAATYEAALSSVMANWESYRGDTTLYDEGTMGIAGCRVDSGESS
ncbi:MAG: hypothetical protein HYV02_06945 [Deltaproteobacteria bacterium]|nr:hypothetical protein [Deltaproteobacteria bacterium]